MKNIKTITSFILFLEITALSSFGLHDTGMALQDDPTGLAFQDHDQCEGASCEVTYQRDCCERISVEHFLELQDFLL